MSDQSLPPPGWYPDPAGPGSRYWDGARWTEHSQPAPTAAVPPPPVAYVPASSTGTAPAAGAALAHRPGALLEQLKRGEGAALVLLGSVVMALSTFLPWAKVSFTTPEAGEISDSGNAWSNEMPWLIRGFGAEEWRTALIQGVALTGGTDLIVFIPLLVAAAALVLVARQGKRISYGDEAVVACSGLLLVLAVLEAVHLGGWVNDLQNRIVQTGGTATVEGGSAFGLWLAIAAAALMTFGAVRALLANRAN
jgi:Protein of unknown function (DUF2510)